MGPRRPVTEPGFPGGSGARAAGCAAAGAAVRSRGSSWEAPRSIRPAWPAPGGGLRHSPGGQVARAAGRGHRCARRTPGAAQVLRPDPSDAATGEGRAGGRGRRRGRAGLGLPTRAVGPWPRPRPCCALPAPGAGQARPWRSRSARPRPASEHLRRHLPELRHLHPLGLGNSPPSLGHSSRPELSRSSHIAEPS